jgi:hypothetical protein
MPNVVELDLGGFTAPAKMSGSSMDSRDKTPVTLTLPVGTTFGPVYIVTPQIMLPESNHAYEFFRVGRWIQHKATMKSPKVYVTKVDVKNRKVTAEAWVWTSRGLDLEQANKLATKRKEAKAKVKAAPKKPVAPKDVLAPAPEPTPEMETVTTPAE